MEQLSLFADSTSPTQNELIVYTDGGCSGNPGAGGWGCVIIDETASGKAKELCFSGGEQCTTNNRMELTAVITALSAILSDETKSNRPVSIFTDSQYVKNGITTWIKSWKRNGWRTASKQPVKNQDLWMKLDEAVSKLSIRWVWVKGHAGIKYNELVDNLCQTEIKKFKNSL